MLLAHIAKNTSKDLEKDPARQVFKAVSEGGCSTDREPHDNAQRQERKPMSRARTTGVCRVQPYIRNRS